jgi:hypothetical protein
MTKSTPRSPDPQLISEVGDKFRSDIGVLAVAAFFCLAGLYCGYIGYELLGHSTSPEASIIRKNGSAMVGLPFAGLGSLVLVLVLRYATGQKRKIKVSGFALEGASGPILLWVVCFLAIVWAIKILT